VLTTSFKSAQGIAWTRGGDEIWFAGSEGRGRAIYAVTLAGRRRLVLRGPTTLLLHDLARDGRALIGNEVLRSGIYGREPGDREERELSWFDWSVAMDLSTDGKSLLFDEEGEGGGPRYGAYLGKTDGSQAVRLGDGRATALSPDGKWVLAITTGPPPAQMVLLPTGAGEPRPLTHDAIHHLWGSFFPDGKRILFSGNEPGRGTRLYVTEIEGSAPRAFTPEWMETAAAIAPDGERVAAIGADKKVALYPVAGGEATPLPLDPGDVPLRFDRDGRALYAYRAGELPARIFRLDLETGVRLYVRSILPSDVAGLVAINRILLTPDADGYVYRYFRTLSDLYLVENLP
jgi:Tol biopolymer transport system component